MFWKWRSVCKNAPYIDSRDISCIMMIMPSGLLFLLVTPLEYRIDDDWHFRGWYFVTYWSHAGTNPPFSETFERAYVFIDKIFLSHRPTHFVWYYLLNIKSNIDGLAQICSNHKEYKSNQMSVAKAQQSTAEGNICVYFPFFTHN